MPIGPGGLPGRRAMSLAQTSAKGFWERELGWLDPWFEPEKAERHEFEQQQRVAFDVLAASWKASDDKLALLEAVAARLGRENVLSTIGVLCADETSAWWAWLVRQEGGSLADLERLLWEPLVQREDFELELEHAPWTLRVRCTRCPHTDYARELGSGADWLYALVCSTDLHVPGAFDPPIRFERTKTLMQGDDYCNHAYFVEAATGS
jgi:hypothetical protein